MEERRAARIGTVSGLALLAGGTAVAAAAGDAHSFFATVLLGLLALGMVHALLDEIRRQARRSVGRWVVHDTANAVLLACWSVVALIVPVLAVASAPIRAVGLTLSLGYAVSCAYFVIERRRTIIMTGPVTPALTVRRPLGSPGEDDRGNRVSGMRYVSSDEDSGRWDGFPLRDGDIVISTRSKSGTTWMQMICALLVFRTPDLPAPLSTLSPWLDWLITPRDEVYAHLAAQRHRRFIKTHTPLDGIPLDPRATYIVVARHPLDMAVSLFHQSANLDRERMAELTGAPAGRPGKPGPEALLRWIDRDVAPAEAMDSLPGVMWHLSDAWRRRHDANVLLVHYADLSADLPGEMRRIAARLGLEAPTGELVAAAGFTRMRARAEDLAPDPVGILKDRKAFFRGGRSGAGRELLTDGQFAHYEQRAATMAPPDLLAWLHR